MTFTSQGDIYTGSIPDQKSYLNQVKYLCEEGNGKEWERFYSAQITVVL